VTQLNELFELFGRQLTGARARRRPGRKAGVGMLLIAVAAVAVAFTDRGATAPSLRVTHVPTRSPAPAHAEPRRATAP
jgi:hypothetical protein